MNENLRIEERERKTLIFSKEEKERVARCNLVNYATSMGIHIDIEESRAGQVEKVVKVMKGRYKE